MTVMLVREQQIERESCNSWTFGMARDFQIVMVGLVDSLQLE